MVPTIVPDNVDYMAIAMEEKARIRDKMPSAILNVEFGSGPNGDGAQEMPNNAEVGFFVSPAVNKTRSHIRSHLRSYNLRVVLRNRTYCSSTFSPPKGRADSIRSEP
jgi:hypothetical protein